MRLAGGPIIMRAAPTRLNSANSTGLFQDTMEGKVQKWVVLIDCVGCMIFFFFLNGPVNYSLRNASPSSSVGCGLMCYPGHGWQWLLSKLWEQLSCKCHQRGSVFIDALRLISHSNRRGSTLQIFYFILLQHKSFASINTIQLHRGSIASRVQMFYVAKVFFRCAFLIRSFMHSFVGQFQFLFSFDWTVQISLWELLNNDTYVIF